MEATVSAAQRLRSSESASEALYGSYCPELRDIILRRRGFHPLRTPYESSPSLSGAVFGSLYGRLFQLGACMSVDTARSK